MNIKRFLFYYCVFAVTGLAIWLALFAPRPQGILLFVLFAPVPIFFWKRVIKSYGTTGSKFSDLSDTGGTLSKKELRNLFTLVLLTSVLVSASTVIAYSKTSHPEVKSAKTTTAEMDSLADQLNKTSSQVDLVEMSNETILREIKDLKRELSTDKEGTTENNIPDPTTTPTETIIKITNSSPIDIYENNSYSAKVIGKSEKTMYTYTKKLDNWYQITLPDGTKGWVSASFVIEL